MTKKQKIWLGISMAMAIVPEILWSPVVNFYYEFYLGTQTSNIYPLRNNFLQNSDNIIYLKSILFQINVLVPKRIRISFISTKLNKIVSSFLS